MWLDEYDALNSTEKSDFRRLVNALLSRTYLLRDVYNDQKKMMDLNSDYRTARRFLPLLKAYFELAGWDLYEDKTYGVIYLRNQFGSNRVRFNYFTTLFLYMLRVIYEENREHTELYHDVRTDTVTVIGKMNAFGLLKDGRTTAKERLEAQKTLSRYQVISKLDGAWRPDGNKLLIYPTILFFLPNSEIDAMYRQLETLRKADSSSADNTENDGEEGEAVS